MFSFFNAKILCSSSTTSWTVATSSCCNSKQIGFRSASVFVEHPKLVPSCSMHTFVRIPGTLRKPLLSKSSLQDFSARNSRNGKHRLDEKNIKKTILGLWHNFSAAALPILDRKSHGILRVLLKLPFWLCQKKGGGLKIYLICLLLKMTLSCRRHPSFWEFWISAYPKTPSFFRICCKDPPHLWLENLAKFPVFWNGMHCKLPVKPQDLVQHLPQVIGQKYQSISYPSKEYHTVCHLQPCNSYFSYEAMNV